jgi:hypothetical protein
VTFKEIQKLLQSQSGSEQSQLLQDLEIRSSGAGGGQQCKDRSIDLTKAAVSITLLDYQEKTDRKT